MKSISKIGVVAAGTIAALLGLLVLIGWHAHVPALVQIRPTLTPMQHNTALCLLLEGVGLCLMQFGWRRSSHIVCAIAVLLAGLTLAEDLLNTSFGLDEFFLKAYIVAPKAHAGRMSPVSATTFILLGSAIILNRFKVKSRKCSLVCGSLSSIGLSLCTIAILGYAIDLQGAYAWGHLSQIAPHTAFGLAILSVGIFLMAWDNGLENGETTPRWLPMPVTFAGFTASLILCAALMTKEDSQITQIVAANASDVKNQIESEMHSHLQALKRMAQRWEFSGRPSQTSWEADAKNYYDDFKDFQAIEWVDESYHIRWVVPLEGNEKVLNLDLTQESHRKSAVNLAEQTRQPALTEPIQLAQGGIGLIGYVPIFAGTNFEGFIVGVFRADKLFTKALFSNVAKGSSVSISSANKKFFERNPSRLPEQDEWIQRFDIEEPGVTWNVQVWPTPQSVYYLHSNLPYMVLGIGILLTGLLATTVFLIQTSLSKNRKLQSALAEVKTLSGMLPICSGCKKVRDDSGYWNQIESYISRRTDASFSHGMCPECSIKFLEQGGLPVPEKLRAAANQTRPK